MHLTLSSAGWFLYSKGNYPPPVRLQCLIISHVLPASQSSHFKYTDCFGLFEKKLTLKNLLSSVCNYCTINMTFITSFAAFDFALM